MSGLASVKWPRTCQHGDRYVVMDTKQMWTSFPETPANRSPDKVITTNPSLRYQSRDVMVTSRVTTVTWLTTQYVTYIFELNSELWWYNWQLSWLPSPGVEIIVSFCRRVHSSMKCLHYLRKHYKLYEVSLWWRHVLPWSRDSMKCLLNSNFILLSRFSMIKFYHFCRFFARARY